MRQDYRSLKSRTSNVWSYRLGLQIICHMPFSLTDSDVVILKGLLKNGRKSFRQISRETGISTPTVKARFDRLVNIGFIKSVSPILDFKKVDYNDNLATNNIILQSIQNKKEESKNKIKGRIEA